MVGMAPCAPCAAGTYSAQEASAACAPCERGKHSLAGASACIECGLKDPAAGLQGTASLDDPDAPRGINCSGGVLRGVVPGYWAARDLAAADTLVISVGGDTVLTDARDFNVLEPVSWSVEVPEDADVVITLGALGLHYDSDPQSKSLDRPFQTPPEAVPSIPWADRNAEAASELVQGRRLAEARHTYEEVLDAEPWHREALLGLADLEFRRGLNSTGLLYARRALQLDAYDTEANFLAGNLYLAAGKVLDAHEAFGWKATPKYLKSPLHYVCAEHFEFVRYDFFATASRDYFTSLTIRRYFNLLPCLNFCPS